MREICFVVNILKQRVIVYTWILQNLEMNLLMLDNTSTGMQAPGLVLAV